MGFFDKLFGGNKPANITLKSPIKGDMINVTEIPDPTFAESVLGPTTALSQAMMALFTLLVMVL